MQIQTITAGCRRKQGPKSHSLMQAMFKLHAQYLDKYLFKYDIWLENHLLIRTIVATLSGIFHRASKLKFELAGTGKS